MKLILLTITLIVMATTAQAADTLNLKQEISMLECIKTTQADMITASITHCTFKVDSINKASDYVNYLTCLMQADVWKKQREKYKLLLKENNLRIDKEIAFLNKKLLATEQKK